MTENIKTIIANVIAAHGINCKRIKAENLHQMRRYYVGGYQYSDYLYRMPAAKMYMIITYDEDRAIDDGVKVYEL